MNGGQAVSANNSERSAAGAPETVRGSDAGVASGVVARVVGKLRVKAVVGLW